MDIDDKIAEYKADIEKCERVCAVTAIGSIRDAAIRKADDCKEMVEWLEDYKRLKMAESKSANNTPSVKVEATGDEFVNAASALTEELPFT